MKFSVIAALAAGGVVLSGCASIVKGNHQYIAIDTPPTTGANCTLSSRQGNWTVVSPGAVSVEKSKEDIQVRCTKEGFHDGVAMIPSNFEGWTVGNLLIGGVIGVGVDAATGAINEYPHSFQVPMQAIPQQQQTAPYTGPAPTPPAPAAGKPAS